MKFDRSKIHRQFQAYLGAGKVAPPQSVDRVILERVSQELNPAIGSVFLKFLAIHLGLSVFTLSVCTQFGLRLFPVLNLMDTFMSIAGHTYCMTFCGALYLGASAFALTFLLTPEEVLAVRRTRFIQLFILATLSLMTFIFFGAEVLLVPAILWLVGGLVFGSFFMEFGWRLRVWALGVSH